MSSRATRRLLLVDDRIVGRRLWPQLLERETHVVAVADGASALQCCAEQQFDVVVADYYLPDITGAELLRRLRARNPALKRIIMADSVVPDLHGLICEELVHDFWLKPVPLEEFWGLVDGRAIRAGSSTSRP